MLDKRKRSDFAGKAKNRLGYVFSVKTLIWSWFYVALYSSWIEENILRNNDFVGRITLDLALEELPLDPVQRFWRPKKKRIVAFEKFKLLSIKGGVPCYLEEISPELPVEKKISRAFVSIEED